MRRIILLALGLSAAPLSARGVNVYGIIVNLNDEKLVLLDRYGGRHVVEAHTYCMDINGFDRDDIVYSTENLDACASATLISRRTGEKCDVWCE